MVDPDVAQLTRLVGDVDRFAAEHWGRQPLLRKSDQDLTKLLSLERVEAMLLAGARWPTFRLVRDGTPLEPRRFTSTVRLGGRALDDVADVARISVEVADGATLVMQGLQRTSLELSQLCRSLERATSHPVQANAYLSPPSATGLAPHSDDHDVLVLQISGAKHWDVAGLGSVDTNAGDVLYLPAGTRHSATTQDATSLHLTLGILRVTRGQVLRRLLADTADVDLRRPLPLGYARPEHAADLTREIECLLECAARAVSGTDVPTAVEHEQQRAHRRRRSLPVGQLTSVLSLGTLDQQSRVRRRADQPAAASVTTPGEVTVQMVDRLLRLPLAMSPALDRLLTGDEVEVASLPGLEAESRLVLVRRLVREGLLVVLA